MAFFFPFLFLLLLKKAITIRKYRTSEHKSHELLAWISRQYKKKGSSQLHKKKKKDILALHDNELRYTFKWTIRSIPMKSLNTEILRIGSLATALSWICATAWLWTWMRISFIVFLTYTCRSDILATAAPNLSRCVKAPCAIHALQQLSCLGVKQILHGRFLRELWR